MMRILLLGGIGEAGRLARRLAVEHAVIYSLAGRTGTPREPICPVRVGGFGGATGMADFLQRHRIELLLDATHPYAVQISRHAALAAGQVGIPYWAYRRPPWQPGAGDDWRLVANWSELSAALADFYRPFFTIGLEPLAHAAAIPAKQHWLVRCLQAPSQATARLALLNALGPFELESELALLREWRIDVLVSKNSGGAAVAAKLQAARRLQLPVVMLQRPLLPVAAVEFASIDVLAARLGA